MRIGIDAKWYFSGNISGKIVIRNLVDYFINNNFDNEIFLFIQKKDKRNSLQLSKKIGDNHKIQIILVPNSLNFINNIIIMPYYVKKHKIESCLYQNFTPLFFRGNCKNIVYIHDFLFFDFPEYFSLIERKIFSLMRFTAKYAHSIITISDSEKVRITKYLHTNKDIYTVHHGVSDDFKPIPAIVQNEIRNKFSLPDKFILFIGRINVRKNIQVILDSMPYIDKDLSLVIIGKKDNKSFDILKKIEELKIKERVYLLGHLEYLDLINILGTAKIFVFPSFAEGFGMPPLEAMKSGIPVIVSSTTSLPEVCGDSAIYFNPKSKDELIRQINILNNDNLKWNFYKNSGIMHANNYNWANSADKIIKILIK